MSSLLFLLLIALCFPLGQVLGDALFLHNGEIHRGRIVRLTLKEVTIRTASGVRTFKRSALRKVVYGPVKSRTGKGRKARGVKPKRRVMQKFRQPATGPVVLLSWKNPITYIPGAVQWRSRPFRGASLFVVWLSGLIGLGYYYRENQRIAMASQRDLAFRFFGFRGPTEARYRANLRRMREFGLLAALAGLFHARDLLTFGADPGGARPNKSGAVIFYQLSF